MLNFDTQQMFDERLGDMLVAEYEPEHDRIRNVEVVERFDIHGSRYGAFVWMTVSFKGDDGEIKEHTFRIYADDINTVSKGTKLECLILGDECYVDRDNLIIVKDEDIKEDLAA